MSGEKLISRNIKVGRAVWSKLTEEAQADGGRTVASLIRKIFDERYANSNADPRGLARDEHGTGKNR